MRRFENGSSALRFTALGYVASPGDALLPPRNTRAVSTGTLRKT